MEWNTKAPDFPAKTCLITMENIYGRYVIEGWAGFGEMRPGAIAWAEYPDFSKSKEGWESEYMGDEKPDKNGLYLVTLMERNEIKFPPRILWYDCKKDTFGGADGIAWMNVPEPYGEVK